jgi:CheY-like chemotaxis protein
MGMGNVVTPAVFPPGGIIGTRGGDFKKFLKIGPGRSYWITAMALQLSSPGEGIARTNGGYVSDIEMGVVLLAVEEPNVARMLTGVFKRAGMNVCKISDLSVALEWLRESPADIAQVFVDCPLPALDMIDFCVSARSWCPGLQIHLAGGEEARSAADAVADASTVYVPKPYLPTELAWLLRGPRLARTG